MDDNLGELRSKNKTMCFGKLNLKTQEVVLDVKDTDVDNACGEFE